MELVRFDPADFLATHWQRAPLLIRNPWDAWECPVEADELAGLACEPQVESRLIEQTGGGWTVEHGPLAEERFESLGANPWTLLVQAVDHHVTDVAALLAQFRFVPNWRVDDVMVSFATTGGGVGPHFDQYDVFLIQGQGRRRWRIGQLCDETTPLLPHADLKLLARFDEAAVYDLEPGDILYVPPGVAHDGVALDDACMTLSIGFRAPSRAELVTGWSDNVLDTLSDDDRYADPGLMPQANPGEIGAAALERLQALVLEALGNREGFARWFGASTTAPKYAEIDWRPDEPLTLGHIRAALAAGLPVMRNPASRFAFVRQEAGVLLFVDGETFECGVATAALAEAICADDSIAVESASDAEAELLLTLCNMGSLAFDDDA